MEFNREKFKVKCSTCGIDAEVPFKPIEDKPVYCADCYKKQRPEKRGFRH